MAPKPMFGGVSGCAGAAVRSPLKALLSVLKVVRRV